MSYLKRKKREKENRLNIILNDIKEKCRKVTLSGHVTQEVMLDGAELIGQSDRTGTEHKWETQQTRKWDGGTRSEHYLTQTQTDNWNTDRSGESQVECWCCSGLTMNVSCVNDSYNDSYNDDDDEKEYDNMMVMINQCYF